MMRAIRVERTSLYLEPTMIEMNASGQVQPGCSQTQLKFLLKGHPQKHPREQLMQLRNLASPQPRGPAGLVTSIVVSQSLTLPPTILKSPVGYRWRGPDPHSDGREA